MTIKERIANYKKKFNNMTDKQQNLRYASLIFVGVLGYAFLCCAWNGFLLLLPATAIFALAYLVICMVRDV